MLGNVYFLALQTGQVAQVVLPSAQQAMPQADSFLADDLPQQAQPLMKATAQMTAAQRVRCLMSFILAETVAGNLALSNTV